jgi:hypothetical protein
MPMEESIHLCIDMGIKLINHNHSQCLVCSLIFLKHIILKLSFVVSLCEHVCGCNEQPHLDATMRILHYVMGQCFLQSFFELKLIDARFVNFVEFDWARELKKKRSTTSMFKIGSCLIS